MRYKTWSEKTGDIYFDDAKSAVSYVADNCMFSGDIVAALIAKLIENEVITENDLCEIVDYAVVIE